MAVRGTVMVVLHAFNENPGEGQEKHLEFWYGSTKPEDEELEDPTMPVVCWCGAKQVRLDKNTCVVWHMDYWPTEHKAREIQND